MPVIPLPEHLACVASFSREAIGLGKRDQVLVTIEFPSDL